MLSKAAVLVLKKEMASGSIFETFNPFFFQVFRRSPLYGLGALHLLEGRSEDLTRRRDAISDFARRMRRVLPWKVDPFAMEVPLNAS
jgi:hypothetical protein